MEQSLKQYTEAIQYPGVAITQFDFWSFVLLLGLWLRRSKSENQASKFESSTIYAILYYTLVLLLEAIYVVGFLFWGEEDGIFKVINKVTELGSQIILIHFVLELSFVVFVIKGNDSFEVIMKKTQTYRRRYIASLAFASIYSIMIIIAYTVNRASPVTYSKAKGLRIAQLIALISRFIFENLAFVLFSLSVMTLIKLKKQAGAPFTPK